MKRALIISGCIACLTFAVSIPVNLLGTSLNRALAAFLFFMVCFLVVPWLFRRLADQKSEDEVSDTHVGQQIDVHIREDEDLFDEVYASRDPSSEHPGDVSGDDETFKPLSAPELSAEHLAHVIRKPTQEQ